MNRSLRTDVRNPVVLLPGFSKLQALPDQTRSDLRSFFNELALDARARAQKSWATHKAPMAVYWKAVSVYAGHIARGLK